MTERTLFSAEYTIGYGGRIVRTHLSTGQSSVVYKHATDVHDMAILGENLLFLESDNGVKALPKNASGLAGAQQVTTTGLNECSKYYSIHVAEGE